MSARYTAPLVVAALSLGACATQSHQQAQRLPDGTTVFECRLPLRSCLAEAERLCRDESYTVLAAHHVVRHYGAESGDSKVVLQESSARVRCLPRGAEPPNVAELDAPAKRGERPPAPRPTAQVTPPPQPRAKPPTVAVPPSPESSAPAAKSSVLCVPGASQACVGPGGCQGGQVCLPDGSGLGACDCGSAR